MASAVKKWQSFRYRENEHIDYRGHAHSGWSEGLVHKSTGWGAPLDGVEDVQQVEKECRAERRPLRRSQEGDMKLTDHAATRIAQ